MRILKFLAAAFVAALAAGSLPAQRPDTDLQAKAREALEQAIAQQDATNNVKPPAKTMPPKAKPAPVVKTTPPPAAPAVVVPDRPTVSTPATPAPADAEAERAEHLRQLEALRAKQAATPAPTVEIAPAPAQTPAPARNGELSPEAEAKARQAMRQAMEELDAQQKTTTAPPKAQVNYTPPPTTWNQTPPASPKTTPVATPPPMTSKSGFQPGVTTAATQPSAPAAMTTRQQQLADLLNKYKMNQISPQEYFQQKAKILAEPGP
jgi:hypothetical protein